MVEGANQFRKLRVTNIQQYAINRGRHVFPPLSTVEVLAKSGSGVAEIRSSVYLKVEDLGPAELPTETTPDTGSLPSSDEVEVLDPRRTVYTGADGATNTVYTGLDQGPREDVGTFPPDADVDRGAIVRGVPYEEQDMAELIANVQARGLEMNPAATKNELVDLLKNDDATGDEKNINIRLDQSDVRVDPLNVAEEAGMVTVAEDVPPDLSAGGGVIDIETMNVPQLRAHARRLGIEGIPTNAKRDQVMSAINDRMANPPTMRVEPDVTPQRTPMPAREGEPDRVADNTANGETRNVTQVDNSPAPTDGDAGVAPSDPTPGREADSTPTADNKAGENPRTVDSEAGEGVVARGKTTPKRS